MQQTNEKSKRIATEDKMSLQEFETIDKEIEQFRVDGKLKVDGEFKWMALRGAVILQEGFGPAVRFKEGKPLYPIFERKLNQYKWLRHLRDKGQLGKVNFEPEQKVEEEIKPEDIPF